MKVLATALVCSCALGDIITLVDGPAIEGKVKSVDEERIVVVVDYGTLVFATSRVLAIEYDLDSRLKDLGKDDYKGRYDLAVWALEQRLDDEGLKLLTGCVGKNGVPNDVHKLLGRLYDEKGEFDKAVRCYKIYLAAVPGDAEIKARIKKLSPKGPAKKAQAPQPATEGLEATAKWKVETWGNPAQATLTTEEGNKLLTVTFQAGGKQDKVAVRGDVSGLDLSKKKKAWVSVCNMTGKKAKFSLAFITPADFFETRTRSLKPGWNTRIEFKLDGKDFKCRATNWTFSTPIKGKDKVSAIELMLYSYRSQGLFYFDDITFE